MKFFNESDLSKDLIHINAEDGTITKESGHTDKELISDSNDMMKQKGAINMIDFKDGIAPKNPIVLLPHKASQLLVKTQQTLIDLLDKEPIIFKSRANKTCVRIVSFLIYIYNFTDIKDEY